MVTKLRNAITNFRQRPDESLFKAWERYKLSIDRCPNHKMLHVTQIDTFYNGLTLRHRYTINAAARGTFMKRHPEECYDLIENIIAHHNDWVTSAQRTEINKNLIRVLQVNQQVKAVTPNRETCGGLYSFSDCPATVGNTQNVYAAGTYQGIKETIILRGTTKEGTNSSKEITKIPQPQVVTTNEFNNFMKANDVIFKNMQTNITSLTNSNLKLKNIFGQFMKMNTASSLGSKTLPGNTITNPKEDLKVVSPIIESVASPVSAPRPNQRPSISYPSRLQDQKLLWPVHQKLFDHKDKICELARTPLNEHCPMVLLKKLPEKLGDPGKFLIPCDFPKMAECLALADLGASINLMPFSVWNKLSLPDFSPMHITLELVDRLISRPVGVAEDVFVKVGIFHFLTDFVVVDFDVDPRVPLILKRSFLKIERSLIDVFEGELTLCVGKEAITFNLDRTSRYSANYNDMTANRIDIIDMAYEEYSQEVLEVDAFLALEDDPTSSKVDQSYLYTEGDILLLEAFMNDDPSLPPLNQGNYFPEVCKEPKICEAKFDKSSIDKPPEVELKDLPPHLEYIFLEEKMFKRCKDTNLYLNWEKSHFMVKEGIVLGHKISKEGIEVEKAKFDVNAKLPHTTTVKAPILIVPDWDMPFELMCDASDFAIGAVLGQRQEKHFRRIHYVSKTMTKAESNYTITEKEMLAMVYAFEKFRSYLIMNKSIVYTDHFALKYLIAKKDSKARLLRWVLLSKNSHSK
nr:reverse transcriptase domain-containing protein [Tanacetum cinerariifolium]